MGCGVVYLGENVSIVHVWYWYAQICGKTNWDYLSLISNGIWLNLEPCSLGKGITFIQN